MRGEAQACASCFTHSEEEGHEQRAPTHYLLWLLPFKAQSYAARARITSLGPRPSTSYKVSVMYP